MEQRGKCEGKRTKKMQVILHAVKHLKYPIDQNVTKIFFQLDI